MINEKYLTWLHSVTTLGYAKGFVITAKCEPIVQLLFAYGIRPIEAIDYLIRRTGNQKKKLLLPIQRELPFK